MSKRLGVFSLITASVVDELRRVHAALEFDSTDVEKDASGVPIAFRMWRAGSNPTDHGVHVLTASSVSKLLAAQTVRGNLFSIDVDHMSLNANAPPENHKAVGWFSIEERDGDLWATNVQWTEAVRAGLAKDPPEWRYFSPAYDTKKDSGEIVRLLNLALTNNPATHHVTALASATGGETKMDEYEKMTLAALLAAIDDEKDEEKKSAMQKCARTKAAAYASEDAPPAPEKKDPPPPAPEKKEADAPQPDKKEAADPAKNEETIAASIADKALINFEQKRRERDERAECDRILASLPAGDRETYKDLSLPQLQRIVKRHHGEVLTNLAAAGSAMPTRAATQVERHERHAGAAAPSEKEALDAEMGLTQRGGWLAREVGTVLEFNHYATPQDAERALAMIAQQRASIAKAEGKPNYDVRESDALNRVLATQNGVI